MSGLRVEKHEGVVCAGCTVKLLGSRLDTFVFIDDGLLVDTGPSRFAREYIQFFRSRPIKLAVLTHFHEDHSGNAPWLSRQGIPVYIHSSSVPVCRKRADLPLYRRLFWGVRDGFSPRPLNVNVEAENKNLSVIEVPGHSYDHIALYDRELGSLFTGDLFVTTKTKIIMRPENIPQIMRSLRLLLRYDFQTVYCGHAGVVKDGKKILARKLEHLENLSGEVLELHRKGWGIRAINKKIFPKKAPLTYISGGEWASQHIIRSIIEDKEN